METLCLYSVQSLARGLKGAIPKQDEVAHHESGNGGQYNFVRKGHGQEHAEGSQNGLKGVEYGQ